MSFIMALSGTVCKRVAPSSSKRMIGLTRCDAIE